MATDYHIYLHSDTTNSGGNKTTPFSTKTENGGGFATKAKKAYQTVKSVANGSVINTGVAALTKALPVVAGVIIAGKITDKILTTGFAHQQEYTGIYKNNVMWNNFKTNIHNILHPIQYALSVAHQNAQFNKQNKEIEQQNRLIGNSILKDFNIGV